MANKKVLPGSRATSFALLLFVVGGIALGVLAGVGALGKGTSLALLAIYLVGGLPGILILMARDRSEGRE